MAFENRMRLSPRVRGSIDPATVILCAAWATDTQTGRRLRGTNGDSSVVDRGNLPDSSMEVIDPGGNGSVQVTDIDLRGMGIPAQGASGIHRDRSGHYHDEYQANVYGNGAADVPHTRITIHHRDNP